MYGFILKIPLDKYRESGYTSKIRSTEGVTMFKHILHNTEDAGIKAYNKLITEKPVGNMPLLAKIEAQRAWRESCLELRRNIRKRLGV